MQNLKFSNDVLSLVYGQNADISEIRKKKSFDDILLDVSTFLATGDDANVSAIRRMTLTDVLGSKQKANPLQRDKVEVPV